MEELYSNKITLARIHEKQRKRRSIGKILATSNPALICTSRGHVSVAIVSTMPSVGRSARDAMPVLNLRDGMSRIAVPVVSEPVPAVVGTVQRGEVIKPED
jgi:hypothetical protein